MDQACPERYGDIGAYIVGALDLGAWADVRQHLTTCTACRAEYENLLPVREWLSRLPVKTAYAKGLVAARRRRTSCRAVMGGHLRLPFGNARLGRCLP
jgi:hypothetical protein